MAASLYEPQLVPDLKTALNRARNGAFYLDSKFGPKWDRKIDLDRLDIGSPFHCICGQLVGHGHLSMLVPSQCVRNGFSCGVFDLVSPFIRTGFIRRAYDRLTSAWKIVLQERRRHDETQRVRFLMAAARKNSAERLRTWSGDRGVDLSVTKKHERESGTLDETTIDAELTVQSW